MGYVHSNAGESPLRVGWQKKAPRMVDVSGIIAAAAEHYASEVKVYHLKKDGTRGRFLRKEPATFYGPALTEKKR